MLILKAISNFISDIFEFISSTLGSLINGLIVGVLTFVDEVLNSLDHLTSIITHGVSAVSNLFSSFLSLGDDLFPFLPPGWLHLIEVALIVLAIGLLIRKKVVG